MNFFKRYSFIISCLLLPILMMQNSGCQKDYSYEGGDTAVVLRNPGVDSLPVAGATDTTNYLQVCAFCKPASDLAVGTWSFEIGKSYACGSTTNSGFFGGYTKMDITFFGPSSCSGDTGLVLSIYLPVPLDRNRSNVVANLAAFYYYDNNATTDIFDSKPERPFKVTVESFNISTGIAVGSFSGTVFKANGDTSVVKNGRYKVLIK